jgi:hypothetical protein
MIFRRNKQACAAIWRASTPEGSLVVRFAHPDAEAMLSARAAFVNIIGLIERMSREVQAFVEGSRDTKVSVSLTRGDLMPIARLVVAHVLEVEGLRDEEGQAVPWADLTDDEREELLFTLGPEALIEAYGVIRNAGGLTHDLRARLRTYLAQHDKRSAEADRVRASYQSDVITMLNEHAALVGQGGTLPLAAPAGVAVPLSALRATGGVPPVHGEAA